MSRSLNIKVMFAILVVAFLTILAIVWSGRGRHATPRARCANDLSIIGAALHYYHMKYNSFPPMQVMEAGDGLRMHSWRVLLLPYLERQDVYDAYNFQVPWNSRENSTVRFTHVREFVCPSEGGNLTTDTNYLFVEEGFTSWTEDQARNRSGSRKALSETALIVEVTKSGVNWLEPRDFDITRMNPIVNCKKGQCISSKHKGGANVLLRDGSVRFVLDSISREELFVLLSADDDGF